MYKSRCLILLLLLMSASAPALAVEEVHPDGALHAVSEDAVSGDTAAQPASFDLLPEIYSVSIKMLDQSNQAALDDLTASISSLISEGRDKEAARMLGAAFGRERKGSRAYLGFYCLRLLPLLKAGPAAEAEFLSGFVKGYGKSAVLLISREGIEKIHAYGVRRGEQWRTVQDGTVPKDKYDRIYIGGNAVYIPFAPGERFTIDAYGADTGTARIWKILPNGVNSKSWPGAKWEREITVRGDKLY